MKYIIKLAMANIKRATRRTILTFMILGVGIGMYIIIECMLAGMETMSFRNIIDLQTGHIKIHSAAFTEEKPYELSNLIVNYESIVNEIAKQPYVKGVTARALFLGEVDNMRDSLPVVITGIDFDRDATVYSLTNFISEGAYNKDGLLIGATLAKDLELKVGDFVYLSFRKKQGAYVSIEKQITGLLSSGDPSVNSGSVYLDIHEVLSLYGVDGATDMSVKTGDVDKVPLYTAELQKMFPALNIVDWKKAAEHTILVSQMKSKFTGIIVLFVIIIALVGIINTMLMSVYEKQREIGTLKALGMTDKQVHRLFLIEGGLIGVMGGILGVIIAILINWYMVAVGMDLNQMMGDRDLGIAIAGVFRSEWKIASFVKGFFIGLLASLFASYYPAKKTTRMQPMECLRVK
ncbi:MAG: ABC transporter permease [Brevinematales bacterium]|nr:ABC transporter permease [Brevinematales bacterium]